MRPGQMPIGLPAVEAVYKACGTQGKQAFATPCELTIVCDQVVVSLAVVDVFELVLTYLL